MTSLETESLFFIDNIISNKLLGENVMSKEFNTESISLLLNTVKSEYNNEHNRTSIIDSKSGIALPIISAYFLALAPLSDYKSIFATHISSFKDFIFPAILFLTYTTSIVLALIAMIKMVFVIATRQYCILKPEDLYDESYLKKEPLVLSVYLINLYLKATENNKTQNDKRIPLYRSSWTLTIISIISFVVYILIKNYRG